MTTRHVGPDLEPRDCSSSCAGKTRRIAPSIELSLTATSAAPGCARAAFSDWLARATDDALFIETVLLLVSELVTNSVRHARIEDEQPLRLSGSLGDTTLRLEVRDGGTQGAVAPRPPRREDDIGGFGLDLVARLSRAWGVDRDAHGTTVWLELATRADPTARPSN